MEQDSFGRRAEFRNGFVQYCHPTLSFSPCAGRFPPKFPQFLDDVPIAAFAALAAPGILAGGEENGPRIIAALVAAVFVWKFRA